MVTSGHMVDLAKGNLTVDSTLVTPEKQAVKGTEEGMLIQSLKLVVESLLQPCEADSTRKTRLQHRHRHVPCRRAPRQ